MDVHGYAKATHFDDMPLGACFGFEEDAKVLVAIKFSTTVGEQVHIGGVVVWPGHPGLSGGRPGIYATNAFNRPLIHYTKATFLPLLGPSDVRAAVADDVPGFLNCAGRFIVSASGSGFGKLAIDLGTGEGAAMPTGPAFYVLKWKIVQPGLGGRDYETICEYPPLPPA